MLIKPITVIINLMVRNKTMHRTSIPIMLIKLITVIINLMVRNKTTHRINIPIMLIKVITAITNPMARNKTTHRTSIPIMLIKVITAITNPMVRNKTTHRTSIPIMLPIIEITNFMITMRNMFLNITMPRKLNTISRLWVMSCAFVAEKRLKITLNAIGLTTFPKILITAK